MDKAKRLGTASLTEEEAQAVLEEQIDGVSKPKAKAVASKGGKKPAKAQWKSISVPDTEDDDTSFISDATDAPAGLSRQQKPGTAR